MSIGSKIDHTLLRADAKKEEIEQLCREAMEYRFASVCVNPCYVKLSNEILTGSEVKVATVIGFPLGANTSRLKALETRDAISNGADEVDMVINIGALKNKDYETVERDIVGVVKEAGTDVAVKVIIETALLSENEKVMACQIAKKAGADFVKTSTGFSSSGASVEDIILMRGIVGDDMKIKASGGIRDFKTASAMIDAGADRIGASASVEIVKDEIK